MKFRQHFGYDVKKASDESAISFEGQVSLTVQSMAEDADINVLMERYGITGKMPENVRVPVYGDFSDVKDYRSALDAVMNASDRFMELPAKVRARFGNDPQELLAFCADDANIEEARKLGLLQEKVHVEERGVGSPGVRGSGSGGAPAATGGEKQPDAS